MPRIRCGESIPITPARVSATSGRASSDARRAGSSSIPTKSIERAPPLGFSALQYSPFPRPVSKPVTPGPLSPGSAASIAATICGSSGLTLVAQRAIRRPSAPTRYLVKFHTGGPDSGWRARSRHSGDGSARTEVRSVSGNWTP